MNRWNWNNIQQIAEKVVHSPIFDNIVSILIVINTLLIGANIFYNLPVISVLMSIVLALFTIEIVLRFVAAGSIKKFFHNGWDVFALILVIIGYLPDISSLHIMGYTLPTSTAMILRILRIFRVFRLYQAKQIVGKKWFETTIGIIIVINAVLIGVETYTSNNIVRIIQGIILFVFTIEIVLRFMAADNIKSFFSNGWNVFDLLLVLVGYIPDLNFLAYFNIHLNGTSVMVFRIVRVFRVLRLIKINEEIKTIIAVLAKSLQTIWYSSLLIAIFVYIFAIVGVELFRMPNVETMTEEQKVLYEEYCAIAPNAPENSPDPFINVGEAMYTLFREITGDDWTDIRYNQITASKLGLINVSPAIITIYHILWFVIAAYVLLNIVVAAIVNNYQVIREKEKKEMAQSTPKNNKSQQSSD